MELRSREFACINCEFFRDSGDGPYGLCERMKDLTGPWSSCDVFTIAKAIVEKRQGYIGNITDKKVVIVYGDVKGNITNADTVVIINGDVFGNITLCNNVAGLLADKAVRCHVGGEI